MTSSKTQTLDFSPDINDLLGQLNDKLVSVARLKMINLKYGGIKYVDNGYFFILSKYRDILIRRANQTYLVDDIVSVIKQYLSSGSVQKY